MFERETIAASAQLGRRRSRTTPVVKATAYTKVSIAHHPKQPPGDSRRQLIPALSYFIEGNVSSRRGT